MKQLPILFFFFLCLQTAWAQKVLQGKVVAIADGDTFTLLVQDSIQKKIRVASIDCPERKQPFSQKAKEFISAAIFNQQVQVEVQSTDRYRRIIGKVTYGNRKDLASELLKAGLAWHFKKYSKDPNLQALEDHARASQKGLWIDPNAIAPWDWRKQ